MLYIKANGSVVVRRTMNNGPFQYCPPIFVPRAVVVVVPEGIASISLTLKLRSFRVPIHPTMTRLQDVKSGYF